MNKTDSINIINKKIHNCNLCMELRRVTPNSMPIWYKDLETVKYLIIGLNPGLEGIDNEYNQKREPQNEFYARYLSTFLESSRMGKFIKTLIEDYLNLNINEFAFTNIIKCRKPRALNFKKDFFLNCKENLFLQVKVLKPKLLLVLGRSVSKFIDFDIPKIVLQHPSSYNYDLNRIEFKEELRILKEKLEKFFDKSKSQTQKIIEEDEEGFLF